MNIPKIKIISQEIADAICCVWQEEGKADTHAYLMKLLSIAIFSYFVHFWYLTFAQKLNWHCVMFSIKHNTVKHVLSGH